MSVSSGRCLGLKEIETFLNGAKPVWRRAAIVLLETGLRRGDALKLECRHIVDGRIPWVVAKTKHRDELPVIIPVSDTLQKELDRSIGPVGSTFLIHKKNGKPMTGSAVSHGMHRECLRLGLNPARPLHGLRKSAVQFLIVSGLEVREVQAITGQSIEIVEHFARGYNCKTLGDRAVIKVADCKRGFRLCSGEHRSRTS